MSSHPLSLPSRADDIVERVNKAIDLESRVEQLESDSGTSEAVAL